MATVTFGNKGTNVVKDTSFPALSLLNGAKFESATQSMFVIRGTDGSKEVVKGQFTVVPSAVALNSPNGVSGFVTGYERYFPDGQLAFSVTGLQQTTTAFDAINYYSPADVTTRSLFQKTNLLFIGNDNVTGGNGNDVFVTTAGNDVIDGGSGTDSLFIRRTDAQSMDSQSLIRTGDREYTLSINGYTNVLKSIERFIVEDSNGTQVVATDINGTAGQAYRLYRAAFDRAPDAPGLSVQINALDNGLSLLQISQNFIDSAEFSATYGNLNNQQFVTQLYANVLDRTPDAPGEAVQLNALNNGMSRAQMLVNFSESAENQAAVVKLVGGAIVYDYFQG